MCFKTRVPASSNNSLTAIGINFGLFPIKLHLEYQFHAMFYSTLTELRSVTYICTLYSISVDSNEKKIFRSKLFNNLFMFLSMYKYITFNSYVILLFHLVYHTFSTQCLFYYQNRYTNTYQSFNVLTHYQKHTDYYYFEIISFKWYHKTIS